MANNLKVAIEIGTKGKKVVAVAPDWPGLERGAKNEEVVIEKLLSYVPRYAAIAKLAGLENSFATNPVIDVVERYQGTGSTEFWGISFAFSSFDKQPMSDKELERELKLMRACWAFFDEVRARVSAVLKRGPRGGGRDRDQIVRHVQFNEEDWAKGLGLGTTDDTILTDERIYAHREAYCDAIRTFHSQGKMASKWPLRYLIRHTAYHNLDHAWEMQDKDLTATA